MEIALSEFKGESDRTIEKMCGVSDWLVSDVRKEQLPESGSSPRKGLDGKVRAMPRTVRDVLKEGPSLCLACRVNGCFSPYLIPDVYYHAPATIAGF